ncbi:MAG: Crp/Fnr family transcriptional regulator [Bacteroidales bacterium]|jgi:CRP-like cAMP-binding protein|nr:Crp/Fnr family transcriptional regulator [Bacteroidales bacterium]
MNKSFIFKCPLCSSIPDSEKEDFLNEVHFNIKSYIKDEWIISQGEEFSALHILIEGEVKTVMVDEKGDFMHIENIKAPLPIASGFLFAGNNKSPVSVIAKREAKIIAIPKDNVFMLMKKHDTFMLAILASISNKTQFLSEKVRLTSLRTIKAKTAYYILRESEGESIFQLKMSKQDIASLFGVSRQALTNVMKQLHEDNIISMDRRKIKIVNRNALKIMF